MDGPKVKKLVGKVGHVFLDLQASFHRHLSPIHVQKTPPGGGDPLLSFLKSGKCSKYYEFQLYIVRSPSRFALKLFLAFPPAVTAGPHRRRAHEEHEHGEQAPRHGNQHHVGAGRGWVTTGARIALAVRAVGLGVAELCGIL